MFTPTLRCECAQPASDRLMRKWCIKAIKSSNKSNTKLRIDFPGNVLLFDVMHRITYIIYIVGLVNNNIFFSAAFNHSVLDMYWVDSSSLPLAPYMEKRCF